ncbi:putative Ig domain-containing protein [Spirosoma rhododendri]|uniref:putative Ig domain-containing protein n=1 Tax=Spirosoma rhododendri TaxID=2728024 RepID=UPI0020C467B0|nr:putative Ig domain-containing protein [Spirosoma rhododendri]
MASLSTNPTSLTGYAATQGVASTSKSYALSGSNLDGNPVSVSATAGIELSTDNSTFASTLSIPATTSSVSTTIYARISSGATTGAFSGTITNTANGTVTAAVSVSGTVNAPNSPSLSVNPTTLSGFSTTQGTASATQTYALSGSNLTNDVTVTAPAGYQVSQDGATFQNSITVAQSNGSVNATITVRLTGASAGPVSGNITNVSGSVSGNVAVSGTVASNTPYTPIATARNSVGQTVTIAGRVTVTNQLGSRQIYIQDNTGGIVVYSGSTGTDLSTLVQLGDSVQARGPISVFSGYTEITSAAATNFTVVSGAGTRIPTPVAITLDQLPAYQGQLVSVSNASITPVASTFTGGTNYTITANNQSATLRINANSPLAGAGQPANPVSVTGIADRFVSGATTTGTNGLQLQPRILADIPGSTPAQDLTCTAGMSNSTLSTDQTLDIAAWNMEFFGADAGTIICPNGNLNYNDMGPTNEDLQQSNSVTVLGKLKADIVAVEEISDIDRFAATVASLPGSYSYTCSNRFSYYFQDECTQTPSGNPPTVFGPTKFAQKVCVIYNKATVTPVLAETKPLLDGNYNYPSANNWSSGRLPFLFVGDATINGVTQRVHVVAIHAKSGSATADYNRRKQDIADLKANLDAAYPNAKLIILGDYNDKLNGSIASGQQSSYKPFVDDASNYSALTLPLENNGCSTFNSSASFIDHMIISNDLAPAAISNSTYVLQPFSIPNYGNTTSDHNPIVTRFDLTKLVTPVTALTVTATANPTQILTTGSTTLTGMAMGGTSPYSYAFTGPGNIAASGNTATVSGLSAGVQTFTVTVTDATTPTAQTSFTTVSVTVTQANTAPTVANPVGPQSATVGSAYTLSVANVFTDAETPNQLTLSASGLPSGLSLNGTTISGTPSTTMGSPYTVTLTATDPGNLSSSTQFTLTINPAATTTPTPTGPFSITGVTLNSCQTISTGERQISFTPQYAGVTGETITFRVVNESLPTTMAGPYTLKLYTDNPVINLRAMQGSGSEVSYAYNWLAACNNTTPTPTNTAPTVANPVGPQSATVGSGYTLSVANVFTDAETPNQLTLSASGLPAGLSLNGISISGTPSMSGVSNVTLTATDPGNLSSSTQFTLTINPAATTTPTPTGPFSITGVTLNSCQTISTGERQISFTPQYAGVTGETITFRVVNESLPTTMAGPYTLKLYTDNPVINLRAMQGSGSEVSYAYNWLAACNNTTPTPTNTAPTVANPVGPQSATVGSGYTLSIANVFTDAETPNQLILSASGLPAGLNLSGTTISGTPSMSGVSNVTLTATDPGNLSSSTQFTLTVNPAAATTPTGPFSITGVSLNSCQTLSAGERQISFTPRYAGVTGETITFRVVNESVPTTAPGPYTLKLYTDNPVINLRAMQGSGSEVSYAYNWLAACNANGRVGVVESTMDVRVIGNPIHDGQASVEVRGVSGQPLTMVLTDMQGQTVGQYQVERAGSVEAHTFAVGRQPVGTLLLRVTTPTQSQTVKLLKVN